MKEEEMDWKMSVRVTWDVPYLFHVAQKGSSEIGRAHV